MIAIIDYGMGNLRSVQKVFEKMNIHSEITCDKEIIKNAEKLILPGVGHFKIGMNNLIKYKIIDLLNEKVLNHQTPILGICLGVQLMAKYSEEGECEGLGWIDAEVNRFAIENNLKYKVPHIGWNNVSVVNQNIISIYDESETQFYFLHSYHLKCHSDKDIWMTTEYEYKFASAIHKNNIYGTQFHPEKSHEAGYNLLKKFAEL